MLNKEGCSVTWNRGEDYQEEQDVHKTWGINRLVNGLIEHTNAVEVYSSEADRDMILKALNKLIDFDED